MNPNQDGPEHIHLPSGTPAARKAGRARRLEAGLPVQPAIVAVMALIVAGAGLWFAGSRSTSTPPVADPVQAMTPVLAPPTPVRPTIRTESSPTPFMPGAVVPVSPVPQAAARRIVMATLPEPPTAAPPAFIRDASAALAPQTQIMRPDQVAHLFNQAVGGFVPYKDQPERRVVGSAVAGNTPCPDCGKAMANTGTTNTQPVANRFVGGMLQYVGPCSNGYIYRITNRTNEVLPGNIVAPDGETWRTGSLAPAQSLEIRSREPINQVTVTPILFGSGGEY